MKKIILIPLTALSLGACSHGGLYEDSTISQKPPRILYDEVDGKKANLELQESPECVGQVMPGMQATQTSNNYNYLLGCSMQRQMMAQIANPEHALGVKGMSEDQMSGTRAATIINGRDTNPDPAPFVPGYLLSDIGGTTE